MAKGVLTTKIDPTYDDLPEQRYHFPRTYLRQIEAAKGDFIIYYEPRRTNGGPFLAGAEGKPISRRRACRSIDPVRADHFYADVDAYLDFARAVPFQEGAHY